MNRCKAELSRAAAVLPITSPLLFELPMVYARSMMVTIKPEPSGFGFADLVVDQINSLGPSVRSDLYHDKQSPCIELFQSQAGPDDIPYRHLISTATIPHSLKLFFLGPYFRF